MSAVADETSVDLVVEVEEAQREHDEALGTYRWLEAAIPAATHYNVLLDRDVVPSARRMRAEARPRGRELDPLERDLQLERLKSEKAVAVRELLGARLRLNAARVAVARAKMPPLVDLCRATSENIDVERQRVEEAFVELVAASIRLNEAAGRHGSAKRGLRDVLLAVSDDKEVRQALADAFRGTYPTAIVDDGRPA